ncbi:MAG: hypothetical protein QOI83_2936 [Streptomycetaceae bacterium]|nr:hypothetical protein [Streptomycetaceae bacterium]
MTSLHRPRARRRLFALLGVAAALILGIGTAPPASADGEIPGVDTVVTSANVQHLVNIPKQALQGFNSDLAFQGKYAFAGNYDGFVVYDISHPQTPEIVSQVLCPGSQNDISVSGNLLILSTDSSRNDNSCASTTQPATEKSSWEGIKVFDISDKANPRYVAAVETDCGSHTHTLVPTKRDVYVYVSSYSPSASFPDCRPPHDGISVVKVPRADPEASAVVNFPMLFPDGGNPGIPATDTKASVSATTGCHDITVYPKLKLAAGACMGDGILMDISDPAGPRVIDQVQDNVNFAFWHSASFNQNGTKVVFTDELGGGGAATCNAATGPDRGADGIYDIVGKGDNRKLVFRSYYKIPRYQSDTENCVAHNGSLIPAKGRDIMVQAWYQGGVSIWDFTDSARPQEIGFFERGPISADTFTVGGSWSAYYYNGYIYSNDIRKGFDVLKISDRRTDSAKRVRLAELNVQSQPDYR